MYCRLIIIQYAKSLSVGQKSDKIVQLRIVKILREVKSNVRNIQNLRISRHKKEKNDAAKGKVFTKIVDEIADKQSKKEAELNPANNKTDVRDADCKGKSK